jgi:hypothetical protein
MAVEKYLADKNDELSSLDNYPGIEKLFLTPNTGSPASAAVERLFFLGEYSLHFGLILAISILNDAILGFG